MISMWAKLGKTDRVCRTLQRVWACVLLAQSRPCCVGWSCQKEKSCKAEGLQTQAFKTQGHGLNHQLNFFALPALSD